MTEQLPGPEQVRSYRKKPVVVEAMLVPDLSEETKERLSEWFRINGAEGLLNYAIAFGREYIHVRTVNGWVQVYPPEYVLRGVKGEFYPCKVDIFDETYDLIPERP